MDRLSFRTTLITLLLLLWGLSACKQTSKDIVPPATFIPYVAAYTGGVISQASSIRVELAQEMPVVDLNAEVKGHPFRFSPALKGKVYWADNKTLEFVPEPGALKQGEYYHATFQLGDFVEVPDGLKKFEFSFRVMARNFSVELDAVDITPQQPDEATLKGEIRLSDIVDKATVEQMLSVRSSDKQQLSVVIDASDNSSVYPFTIAGIRRGAEDIDVTLAIDGKRGDMNQTAEAKAVIPAKGVFKFISGKRITRPENGIQLAFSEPISDEQDLKGLITLGGISSYIFQVSDNKVNVFFEETSLSSIVVTVNEGIRSSRDAVLKDSASVSFSGQSPNPQVKILSKGTILPDSKNLIIPFQAVGLYAVDISVVRIFEGNVLMFMQDNSFSSSNELRRSGRLVYKKMFRLDTDPAKRTDAWEDYSIDLSGLIQQEPGALYRVEIGFRQDYSAYSCGDGQERKRFAETAEALTSVAAGDMTEADNAAWDIPNTYYNSYYANVDWDVFNWSETANPCHPSYYMTGDKFASCIVLATNIGLIAKQNATNTLWVTVTDILSTDPLPSVDVTAYNFQLQPVGTARTDANGMAEIKAKGKPFIVVAALGKQKTYLKVQDGEELSVSRFDVSGKEIQKGLKGFIYGERGVWRPGDTLHVSFILEDQDKRIPDRHPVSFELYNPRGQFYSKLISSKGTHGFYTFSVPTKADDPTGLWNGYIKVGGTAFHKAFRIEAIKPNRLKINLQLPGAFIDAAKGNVQASVSSAWLTGATASDLKVKVEMTLAKVNTQFPAYAQYLFTNPATEYASAREDVFEGRLNQQGNASFTLKVPAARNAPGLLQANITTQVFEPGGDASIQTSSVPFSPFAAYVGVNLNQPKGKYIETDTDHTFDVVTVNAEGKPVNRSNLEYKIYRVNWSWWWENRDDSFESYINNTSITPEATGLLSTVNGKAQFKFRVDYPNWGRYLVYVKDKDSGHASGGTVYIDWPDWRGRSEKKDPSGITMLSFSVDKESYEAGETVTVMIPAAADGHALVALENGSSVLKRDWVEVKEGKDAKYQFTVTADMAPNIYVHVTLLQPHAQTVNDLPIRMYGVVPVFVTNKESVLEPQIKMPDVLRPETEFTVSVSERKGKPMTYTLAIVDDGLLDLTNFKTPDPWSEFYARELLGIRTWDMFDQVVGAYSGRYSSLFSVGGDEMLKGQDAKANRFRPVVKFLGPFILDKGKSDSHRITLPMYVGSVRTMVIAGQDGAYGWTEKTTPVRSPLMILSTLPRVVSVGEEMLLPVNVFAMEESVKDVTVSVESSANLALTGGVTQSVHFAKAGDQLVFFRMKAGMQTGKATVRITASGGGQTTKETIEIDVRNPNPVLTQHTAKLLGSGESVELPYHISGNLADSWVRLEVSRIPSVDISRRLDYLYNYQHYCSEQITSCALPLLFVSQFKDMDATEAGTVKKNVREAINNLYGRQLPNGGFVYWPGNASADEWITSYVGNFLVLAQEKGYEVNQNVLNKWKAFQKRAAQNWTPVNRESSWYYWQSDLQQAYRLYTLALANAPEMGAMNRMKEMKDLSLQARWRLAAAYAVNGKMNPANELVFNAQTMVDPYASNNDVYGSNHRDEAMVLETLVLLGKEREAFTLAQKVSKNLSEEYYFSTQSTAFSLMAMGRLAEILSGSIDMVWKAGSLKAEDVKTAKAVYLADIPTSPQQGTATVANKGSGALYVDLITRTQLVNDTLPVIANNLRLQVQYEDLNGRMLDISSLKQGTDIVARVTVANISGTTDYKDIALTHIVPSGWEIYNERMIAPEGTEEVKRAGDYTYRDIRDDRVLTYFDLGRSQSKTFTVRLQAAYAGSFVLPAIQCEAMYDTQAQARTRAGRVTVER